MNKYIKTLSIFAVIALFTIACSAQVAQAHSEKAAAPMAVTFESVLGKSMADQTVADFITSNGCSSVGSLQLCKSAGMALWVNPDQRVETVYLYPSNVDGFQAFQGELPFRLASFDTMESVEMKFGTPKVADAPYAGWEPGLPDEGGTPDHVHYWAVYKRFGITIIYNSPSAEDKAATIHAVLVSKK